MIRFQKSQDFIHLGQEILGGVEPVRFVEPFKDGYLFRLGVSDADEDGGEPHLALQLLHGQVGGAQVATGLDLKVKQKRIEKEIPL